MVLKLKPVLHILPFTECRYYRHKGDVPLRAPKGHSGPDQPHLGAPPAPCPWPPVPIAEALLFSLATTMPGLATGSMDPGPVDWLPRLSSGLSHQQDTAWQAGLGPGPGLPCSGPVWPCPAMLCLASQPPGSCSLMKGWGNGVSVSATMWEERDEGAYQRPSPLHPALHFLKQWHRKQLPAGHAPTPCGSMPPSSWISK